MITDEEFKTLLRSNRAFLSQQSQKIKELTAKVDRLNTEAKILDTYCIQIKNSYQEFSNFQISLNDICKRIQSQETKKRIEDEKID